MPLETKYFKRHEITSLGIYKPNVDFDAGLKSKVIERLQIQLNKWIEDLIGSPIESSSSLDVSVVSNSIRFGTSDQYFLTKKYLEATAATDRNLSVSHWHQDGHNSDSDIFRNAHATWVLLWCNHKPTLIKPNNDLESPYYIPEDYEIVLFNNKDFVHMAPKITDAEIKKRCFVRQFWLFAYHEEPDNGQDPSFILEQKWMTTQLK